MKSGLWLAVLLALGFGILGYLVGRSRPSAPPPAPPPPGPPAAASCVAYANLIYDAQAKRLTIDQKPFRVVRPAHDAAGSAACWNLVIQNATAAVEFETLKIKLDVPAGRTGRPVVVGDTEFRGSAKAVSVRFEDEPLWGDVADDGPRYRGVKVRYEVEAKLKDDPTSIAVDPYMIIREGGTGG